MKLMSMKQYSKMTKASLVRKIMKALKKLPKMKLAKLCYELEKKRLPSISTARRAYKNSGLEIRKEKPHHLYPTKPSNMSKAKWNTLYKPQYLVQQKQRTMPDGTVLGMAYNRETTLKKAKDTKKFLERKLGKRNQKRKKPRSAKQRANDKRLGLMAKRRAKAKRRLR